ncbi:MAG: response regulator [Hydrogenophaga sp.]|nr:response regulator [Hydrogenophaga sp.]
MWYDLQTLLALWSGLDVVVGLAFLVQYRRLRRSGGPGWWALACAVHLCALVALAARPLLPAWVGLPLGNLLFIATFGLLWVGLRAHVGLPVRRALRGLGLLLLVLWPVNVFFVLAIDSLTARHLLWAGTNVALLGFMLRDLHRQAPRPMPAEWLALNAVLWFQVAGLLGSAALARTLAWGFEQTVGLVLFFFFFAYLLTALAFHCMITLRLRQEADAARAEQRQRETDLRRLVDNLDAGVMVFLPDHLLQRLNTAARRFLGWPLAGGSRLLPEPVRLQWQMLGEDGQPLRRHDQPFERVLMSGQPVRDMVVGLQLPDGSPVRWALCSGYPESDVHGGLRRVVMTFIDITAMRAALTEQKALEVRLAQSQKMQALGTLAGGVAHDFNNILAAILGNADLAREDLPPDARAHQSLDEISTAARRGRELVRQILAFSRQQPMVRGRLRLSAMVAESCALLRAALPPQVQLVQTVADDLPDICADATQLQQVLVNLGTNALHAMHGRSGRVAFVLDTLAVPDPDLPPDIAQACAASGQPAVRLRVSDEGCGMEDAVLHRVFEPFFTTKPVGQGTGLGLPVVLGIVEAHGGHIALHSRVGEGTTITLLFPPTTPAMDTPTTKPVTMPRVEPTPTTRPTADTEQAPHVLYLDDDETLVFLVRRLLERRGYRVTAVGLQDEALRLVRERPGQFALLLTDYNMPGMSGLEVARHALAADPALTVAVASGYITDELQAEAKAAGVREVVFKTDAVDQFCEIVARLVKPAEA